MNKIRLITLTNFGYIKYILNLLSSLKNINLSHKLIIYCLDKQSVNFLKNNFNDINVKYIDNEYNVTDLTDFRTNGWNKIVYYKLKIIKENLEKGYNVIFTDGDIVFLKNPIDYLKSQIKDYDMLCQEDVLPIKKELVENQNPLAYRDLSETDELNSGFMYIKNNEKMKRFFDYTKIDINTFKCDQIYLNENKHNLKYKKLELDLFPTGYYYYTQIDYAKRDIDKLAYIIHFNFNFAKTTKIEYIKLHKKWFLEDLII
jgi:hypothetical protein